MTRNHTILSANRNRRENNLSSLRKRAPIESLFNFHQTYVQLPFARTSPSTFLFLLSSQCQRADPEDLAVSTSLESNRFQKSSRTKHLVAGCPEARSFLPEAPEQWERKLRSTSSSAAGCIQVRLDCQHPFFFFQTAQVNPKPSKSRTTKIANCLVVSVPCFSLKHLPAPPPEAMTGL